MSAKIQKNLDNRKIFVEKLPKTRCFDDINKPTRAKNAGLKEKIKKIGKKFWWFGKKYYLCTRNRERCSFRQERKLRK